MASPNVRTSHERKADVLARIHARHAETWVASASASGVPHLVCLRPERVQAWQHVSEHPGRTIMREGRWVA
ncbi:MAG: hypothetical protein ACRDN0_26125 [Trebonia sp.]